MKSLRTGVLAAAAIAVALLTADAAVAERPGGIRIGQRFTLKPYLAISASYDSNVESTHGGGDDVFWTVNPGFNLDYRAENWSVIANAYYQYNSYVNHSNRSNYDYHGYGESLAYNWTNSERGEKGWSLMLSESYTKINPTDDMSIENSTYGGDRQEVRFSGGIQRRFGNNIHADVNGGYYWLDYDNYGNRYTSGLYGWSRWMVGGEVGWAPSRFIDLLLAGSYQGYNQDNPITAAVEDSRIARDSDGVTFQGGFGSFMTDRITYRVLVGWSQYSYGGSYGRTADGFTYTISGNWKISDTLNTMLLATSYYQPTEREYGGAQRVDALSWGIAKAWVRNKLTTSFDVAYRREGWQYTDPAVQNYDYDIDVLTFRFGVNYYFNRFFGIFANVDYRRSLSDGGPRSTYYDYDRVRGTLGMRFTY